MALVIAISPYLFYLYESAPTDSQVWNTYFFDIKTNVYASVNLMLWIWTGKVIPLILLIFWFFTCKHWWYHVILIPIAMYVFQLFSLFNSENGIFDVVEIYYLIPIMMVIIPFVYLIRLKIFDKVVHGIDLKKLDEELERLEHLEDYHDDSLEIE
ncbi:hypothetical protein GWK10_00225 [Spongiivirga citrea]|uniref:Uncharacterized protein n=1 Tax=Spongiivirga citrea TaxID=1481457 RepID=A0A6M0CFF4_9FLAO|nr:hypothetical protein [Spongiivirga citrea]